MPSLDEAYSRSETGIDEPRRVLAGLVLVGAGVCAVAAALVLLFVGGDSTVAKQYAGITAGLGIPILLLGVVVVLSTGRRARVGVGLGTALTGAGVGMFWHVYPSRWTRTANPLAFETMMVYGLGCAIALWFVFSAITSFRRRNNPQGTVELEVVQRGETQTIAVSRDRYRSIVSDGGDTSSVIEELDD